MGAPTLGSLPSLCRCDDFFLSTGLRFFSPLASSSPAPQSRETILRLFLSVCARGTCTYTYLRAYRTYAPTSTCLLITFASPEQVGAHLLAQLCLPCPRHFFFHFFCPLFEPPPSCFSSCPFCHVLSEALWMLLQIYCTGCPGTQPRVYAYSRGLYSENPSFSTLGLILFFFFFFASLFSGCIRAR